MEMINSTNGALCLLVFSSHQKRRVRLIENLLTGKKTVATLYWAMRYQLLDLLGVGRYFNINQLEVNPLVQNGLIMRTDNDQVQLTAAGKQAKEELIQEINGSDLSFALHTFQKIDLTNFKQRFQLLVQVLSERVHHVRQYYPINVDGTNKAFIKKYYRQIDRDQAGALLKDELNQFLSSLEFDRASLFAQELVGFNTNGLTMQQIAANLNQSLFKTALNDLINYAKLVSFMSQRDHSIVAPLLNGLSKHSVSTSAEETFTEYQQLRDLKQVEKRRKLRESTVLEHLLEVAIYTPLVGFPYRDFVSYDLENKIIRHLSGISVDDWDYQQLSDFLSNHLSFFQFRLLEIKRTKQDVK
ncbi:hypothetical protein EFM02_02575 [Fructilactobacillus fructivorans]|nr:hypothetical protein [Fructilactobacillus fructivorans]MCT2868045.1 hypothetical protein [Fructilactobacillus fructivorans]MCT2868697.1 hypothetical protein [Fructilactobacillus fructivorans]MCT2873372.1 hypothetical protein [Fructilactobacillus fructivorans]